MNIGLSDITHSFRFHSGAAAVSIKHGNAQQLLVAAFGYKTLAAYQVAKASDEELENFKEVRHVVLDRACLTQRAAELGIECNPAQLIHFLTKAFAHRLAGTVLHRSYGDLEDYIRAQIEHVITNNGRINGQIDEANHDGLEEVYFELKIDLERVQVGSSLKESVPGHVSLRHDPDRPYAGTKIDFRASVTAKRLGRRCFSNIEYEVTGGVLKAPWDEDHDDFGEPPIRSRAEAYAELLGWKVDEVGDLEDVEEMPLDGSSGEMIYGYLIDFSDYASTEAAARIMREHGTLQFEVGPAFFDGVRYAGWPH
ncbi:hypothetical protein KHF85_00890 [Xanthomonas translucens pv. graminis]|uniref:hypothetical protein n=1 Tax=Xanthomonas graminis TaxID=3390026 RepID=UPI00253F8616|nr:hypothetical protein [Xanthomonas translucens]WIH05131.1 hypothetical protein KHF85_00890 [Xanthomonas translucens pv. graminis]